MPAYIQRMAPGLRSQAGAFLFEEVPALEVHRLARRWSYQLQACASAVACEAASAATCNASSSVSPNGFAVYATVSLEYGEGGKRLGAKHDQNDVFSLRRAHFSDDDASQGRFLHPVVRVFVSGQHRPD